MRMSNTVFKETTSSVEEKQTVPKQQRIYALENSVSKCKWCCQDGKDGKNKTISRMSSLFFFLHWQYPTSFWEWRCVWAQVYLLLHFSILKSYLLSSHPIVLNVAFPWTNWCISLSVNISTAQVLTSNISSTRNVCASNFGWFLLSLTGVEAVKSSLNSCLCYFYYYYYFFFVNCAHSRFWPLTPMKSERLVTLSDLSKSSVKVSLSKCLLLHLMLFIMRLL